MRVVSFREHTIVDGGEWLLCNQKMKKKIIDIIEETICNENEKILPTYKIKDLNIDSLDMYETFYI